MKIFKFIESEGLDLKVKIPIVINKILPDVIFRLILHQLAAHRDVSYWPGWKYGVVQDTSLKYVSTLRGLLIYLYRQRKTAFTIKYQFQNKLKINVHLNETIGKSLFISGCYEPNEFAYLDEIIKPDMKIVDIGANIGLYTIWMAKRIQDGGEVIALEPSSREFKRLEQNIILNDLDNVTMLKTGASDSRRSGKLHISNDNEPGLNTLGEITYSNIDEIAIEDIALNKVDNILSDLKIGHVDIIKIDVEGHEYFALQGMEDTLKRDHPILILEINEESLDKQNCSASQIFRFLQDLGYHLMAFDLVTGSPISIKSDDSWYGNNLVCVPNR